MTDQVPSLGNTNFTGAGGVAVNVVAGTGLHSLATPGHLAISLDQFGGGSFPGTVPGAPPLTPATDYLGADGTWHPAGASPPAPFSPGTPGIVSDPGVAPATDYLGADNTFRPLPVGGGVIVSLNGDATPAQTLLQPAGSPINITDVGGGVHSINISDFSAVSKGGVPNPIVFNATSFLTVNGWENGSFLQDNAAAGVAVVNGVPNALASVVAPYAGVYHFSAVAGVVGIPGQLLTVSVRVNGVAVTIFDVVDILEGTNQLNPTANISGFISVGIAGQTIDVAVNHHGGGVDTTSTAAQIQAMLVNV